MRKAQAAMEFLMTYGWAILVVLAAVAALAYFGVLSPARYLPETCDFPGGSGFTCVDGRATISDANNRFDFAVKNSQGFRVNITGMSDDTGADDDCSSPTMTGCKGVGCSPAAISANGLVFDNDDQGIFRVTCSAIGSGRFQADVVLNYCSFESGLCYSTTGRVRGAAT